MFTPKFTITNKLLTLIGRIEASKEVIENAPLVPFWEKKFQNEAMVRTVHHGTHVEGNPLEANEVEKVLAGEQNPARAHDIQEIINYRNVLNYIGRLTDKTDKLPCNEKLLLKLHELVMEKTLPQDTLGKFRKTQVVVRNSKTGMVSFTPPPFAEVPQEIENFLAWLISEAGQNLHPVFKASIVHYEISRIHPFVDGNGRVARALATLVLFLDGYDIRGFFSLEEYFDRNPQEYYKTLQETSNQLVIDENQRDLTLWLEYFVYGLAGELEKVKERVRKLSLDSKLKGKVGQIALSERQMKLVEYMQENGQIKASEFEHLFPQVSDDTIWRDLKDLIKKKLVKKKGSTKGSVYLLR